MRAWHILALITLIGGTSRSLAQGFVACIYDDCFQLRNFCQGGDPLPDGTTGLIYYDGNSNGPDSTDLPAPVCLHPPDCPNGPPGTVNFNTFHLNAAEMDLLPGEFLMDPCLTSSGITPTPSRYYIVVPAGPTVWTSRVMTIHVGPQDVDLCDWTCNCGDAQVPTPGSFVADDSTGCWAVHLSWTYTDTNASVDGFRLFRDYSVIRVLDASARSFDDSLSDSRSHLYQLQARRNNGGQISYSIPAWDHGSLRSSYMRVEFPNGGESWRILQSDTVRWIGCNIRTKVKIELNRNYPSEQWEVLTDSTDNDGEELLFLSDPLSAHCRVSVSTVGGAVSDISDADFAITSSQGYLAWVRTPAQEYPIISWNAGTVECPQVYSESFRLKNFGSEAIEVWRPYEPPSAEFSRTTTCATHFTLTPGQMSACALTVTFDPVADGSYHDTLRIPTNAVNQSYGYLRIPLAGTQISTPAVPQVVIQAVGENIRLDWQTVTQSVGGCPVTVTRYLVFYAPTMNEPYYYHGYTAGTSYTHVGAVSYAMGMFYQVVSYTGALSLLEGIERGEGMEEVRGKLKY